MTLLRREGLGIRCDHECTLNQQTPPLKNSYPMALSWLLHACGRPVFSLLQMACSRRSISRKAPCSGGLFAHKRTCGPVSPDTYWHMGPCSSGRAFHLYCHCRLCPYFQKGFLRLDMPGWDHILHSSGSWPKTECGPYTLQVDRPPPFLHQVPVPGILPIFHLL